jgi:hypothetical protein
MTAWYLATVVVPHERLYTGQPLAIRVDGRVVHCIGENGQCCELEMDKAKLCLKTVRNRKAGKLERFGRAVPLKGWRQEYYSRIWAGRPDAERVEQERVERRED